MPVKSGLKYSESVHVDLLFATAGVRLLSGVGIIRIWDMITVRGGRLGTFPS